MPQYSTTVRNAKLDAIESTIGTTPTLSIYSGSAPANCAAADTGTLLATLTLPSDWMAAASGGSKALAGSWTGTASGGSAATPTHYRIKQGGTCHMQGTAGIGSGELQVNGTITSGQAVSVTAFTINDNNP
jgi:hypothetical protein